MAYFVVSYDLRRKAEFDYSKLWAEFKRLDGVKYQESAYFIELANTPPQVKDHFSAFMHEDDLLMVVEFSERPSYTRGLQGTNDWVKARWP